MTFLLNIDKVIKHTSYVYYYQWDIYLNKKDNIDRIAEVMFPCPCALLFGVDNTDWQSNVYIVFQQYVLYFRGSYGVYMMNRITSPHPPKKSFEKYKILK